MTRNSLNPSASARFVLVILLVFAVGGALADPPAGYYDSVDYTNAGTIRVTLHNIIDGHTKIPYTSASTDTWNVLELADEDPNNSTRIIDVYKNSTYPKWGAGNNDYNREHTWPKSYGFPDDNSSNLPYSDCHMLMLCNDSYNSSRSNNIFDDCASGCSSYPTDNYNGQVGVNYRNVDVWETWIGRRGDVARAQFYADVRYAGDAGAEPDLILTDNTSLIVTVSDNASVAYMGVLKTLIQWHKDDPVDDRERNRNDVVQTYQGNRNPFIDHPEFVAYLFEGVVAGVDDGPSIPEATVTIAGIYPNPFNPMTTIDFSLTRSGPVQVVIFAIDGKVVRTLLNDNREAGDYHVRWNGMADTGSPVSSGAYFCRILGGGEIATKPLLLLK
ncbi:MAG: endonuclease [Candidatus Krumholzibacteria bacterium]|nr:endonuclease [Candidatus Krumholzibacteria bacterium]